MKKFLFAFLCLMSLMTFAQVISNDTLTVVNDTLSTTPVITGNATATTIDLLKANLVTIFLPALLTTLLVLLSDAAKYFSSPDWSWKIFYQTKVNKFLLISVIALVLVLVNTFLPKYNLLEMLFGSQYAEITTVTLFGLATALYDNLTKPKKI